VGITGKQRGMFIFPDGAGTPSRSFAADGAIGNQGGTVYLTKAGVGAYTLAAPGRDNVFLNIVNRTANAHIVTATGLLDDGVTGGSKNTITFAAFAGACCQLVSGGGKWNTLALKAATVP
jgi:hypothetical protein